MSWFEDCKLLFDGKEVAEYNYQVENNLLIVTIIEWLSKEDEEEVKKRIKEKFEGHDFEVVFE